MIPFNDFKMISYPNGKILVQSYTWKTGFISQIQCRMRSKLTIKTTKKRPFGTHTLQYSSVFTDNFEHVFDWYVKIPQIWPYIKNYK